MSSDPEFGYRARSVNSYRGRFAPSPTGDLHLGSIATALVAWLRARRAGGRLVLRVEDIDTPRVVRGSEARQLEELHWLGLEWDEGPDVGGELGPYRQSQRLDLYEAALRRLAEAGLTYLCDCSRAEILGVASAPHVGEEGPIYPGTCRPYGMAARRFRRPPAVRLAVPRQTVAIDDVFQGAFAQAVGHEVGDFVLRRGDGIFAYQLAVVVDDLGMHIEEVVRGYDLLSSAPRQRLLADLLGGPAPRFAHVPLVVDSAGQRLEKRSPSHTVAGLRAASVSAASILGRVAWALGMIAKPGRMQAAELLERADLGALHRRREAPLPAAQA